MVTASRPVNRPRGETNYAMNSVRIVAALLVVVSHVRPLIFVDFSDAENRGVLVQAMYAATSLGHQAVIVFFVLSGYWVGGSVIRNATQARFDAVDYATARLTRLWLVLLPTLLLTHLLDRVGSALFATSDIYSGSEAYHTVVPVDGPLSHLNAGTTLGNVFFLQDVYVSTAGTNTPLWSLAAEFWYYLLFPAVLVAALPGALLRTRIVAATTSVAGALLLSFGTQSGSTLVLLLFPTWLLGAVISWQRDRIVKALGRLSPSGLAGARWTAIALTVAAAIADSRLGGLATTLLLAGCTAIMIATMVIDVNDGIGRRALRPLSWAAEWSYSLYATHLPVAAFMAALLIPSAGNRLQMTPTSFILLLAITAAAVIVAIGFFYAAEKHTDRVRRSLRYRSSRTSQLADRVRVSDHTRR